MKRTTEFARTIQLAKERHPDKIILSDVQKKGKPPQYKAILGLMTPKQIFSIFKLMEKEGYHFTVNVTQGGNTKLGEIPSISLPAGHACSMRCPGCYGMHGYFCYNANIFSAFKNWYIFLNYPEQYFNDVRAWLQLVNPRFFRWHVIGDIQNQMYYDNMVSIANAYKDIKFLVFTKRYTLDYSVRPDTLAVVLSAWPNVAIVNTYHLPVAYMQDGTEDRMPADVLTCPGTCMTCAACWNLPELKRDVLFHKH